MTNAKPGELSADEILIARAAIRWANGQRVAPQTVVDIVAESLWIKDYPSGGFWYKTYESTPFHDKELYRKEALALLTAHSKGL